MLHLFLLLTFCSTLTLQQAVPGSPSDGREKSFGGSGTSVNFQDVYARGAPQEIWNCYFDWTLRDRFMRLPQSMDNLIGLIRKIENFPAASSWDIEKTTSVILKRFRHDGIFFRPQDYNNPITDPIYLYSGNVAEEQKLGILHKLAPDRNANEFPEDALTEQEKCGLHFMLSYSLNDTYRPDENTRGGRNRRDVSAVEDTHESHDFGDEEANDGTGDGDGDVDVPGGNLRDDSEPMKRSAEPAALAQQQAQSAPSGPSARQAGNPLYQESQYPLEYGVVYSRYGTVAAGPLLSGISFGLQERTINVGDLLPENSDKIKWPSDVLNRNVINYYAGTVAGDIAQSAVQEGNERNARVIGPGGVWNDTVLPTEYSLDLRKDQISYLTDAEVLGGIDGLIMAKKIRDWDQSHVKLSHLLEMYFSPRGVNIGRTAQITGDGTADVGYASKFRACNRFELMKDEGFIKKTEFEDQVRAFAYPLFAAKIPIASPNAVETIKNGVDRVLKEFWSFVESEGNGLDGDWDCPNNYGTVKETDLPVETKIDIHVLMDSDASEPERYGAMYGISQAISKMQLDHYGTNRIGVNMTQSDNWFCFLDVGEEANKAMVAHKMLRAENGWGYSSKLDLVKMLEAIRHQYQAFTREEFMSNTGGTNAKVFLLVIPNNRPQQNGMEERDLEELFEQFYEDHPDIEIIIVTKVTEWRKYLRDDVKNYININQVNLGDKLYERFKEIPARLTFPKCKDGSDYEAGNKYEGYYTPGTKQLLAYNAHYFFSSGTVELRVKFDQKIPLNVCVFRDLKDNPNDIKCAKVLDQADNSVLFEVRPRCGSTCEPIYFSLAIDPKADMSGYMFACSDERKCAFPDQVEFEITHENMRCNSAAGLTSTMIGMMLASLVIFFNKYVM